MRKIICLLLLTIMPIYAGMAATVQDNIKTTWGYNSMDVGNGSPGGFILYGGTGTNASGRGPIECYIRGNQTQAHGVIGIVARQIVEHGGYFCPTQVQCDSKASDNPKEVYFAWYNPATSSAAQWQEYADNVEINLTEKCAWLCDEGYYGTECSQKTTMGCEPNTDYEKLFDKSGFKMRTTHNRAATEGIAKVNCKQVNKINSQVAMFDSSNSPAKGVILGVTKVLKHGVVAAPIKLECAKRSERKAWLEGISRADGQSRVLCAMGYKPSGEDCVPINEQICKNPNIKYCKNFPSDKYNAEEHTLNFDGTDDDGNPCIRYFCSDDKKSFTSSTDKTCIDCDTSDIRNGVSKVDGLCKTCKTGQYFSSSANDCADAATYTKDELKFGIGSKSKEFPITSQCWPKVATDYTSCVGKKN